MNSKEITILTDKIEQHFLPYVRRPSRYIGGEINQIKKDLNRCDLKVALCFPDIYEVGMSHTGLAIIYDVINEIDGVAAERVFAPWLDAEKLLRRNNIPIFSLESKAALKSFDVVGFSLTNELCYTNVLNILDLADIPLRSSNRSDDEPLIIGGGGMANCCEPIADFFDMFILGEGENAVVEIAKLLLREKNNGSGKREILQKAARCFKYVYVPGFYELKKNHGKQTLKSIIKNIPRRFENAVVDDFDNASVVEKPIVPFTQIVHDRINVEIMRGCPGRCRFCQASFCRRPVRFRSIDRIFKIAKKNYLSTGLDTISLFSLSSGDYPNLEQLVDVFQSYFEEKHVGLSLPSLRVDQQLKLLPKLLTSVRKGGITIAVEAASERLRQIINKPLKDEDLFAAVAATWKAGWGQIKLYFMAGLPGENEEDIKKIAQLCFELAMLRKDIKGRPGQINAAVSWFVPKAHTPFGWLGQKDKAYFENAKQTILDEKKRLRAKFINFKFHDIGRSVLESAIGRGDRRLSNIIEKAFSDGAKFDLWDECFDYQIWQKAFAEFGLDIQKEAQRRFETDEVLPWEHLGGPKKDYLLNHLNDALEIIQKSTAETGG